MKVRNVMPTPNNPQPRRTSDPVLKAITAAGVVLAAVKTFVSHLLLPPFWEDCIVAFLLLASSTYWLLELRKDFSGAHRWNDFQKKLGILALFVLQVGLCVWFLIPPLSLILHGRWTVCGTFVIENPQGACLMGYDTRGREISDVCADFDEAGWLRESPTRWWIYRPHSFAIRRAGAFSPRFIPAQSVNLFSPSCEGVVYPK